ncbi:MAG: 3-dehydroquinate synthase [Hydrogenibacillus sp.]|nr:3-dehydroquinate synthase [Hydrogenibacillus sp.]
MPGEKTCGEKHNGLDGGARTLTVSYEGLTYPVVVGDGLLRRLGSRLEGLGIGRDRPLFVLTDAAVRPLYGEALTQTLKADGYRVGLYAVPSGEAAKSLAVLEAVVGAMLEAGIDRRGVLLALGGGVVGDLGGFAAATYMRGIDYVQLPTTVLAHDSSVGGKVAVNHPKAKNAIGAFYPPRAVLYDVSTLRTLTPREVRAGLAELVKHALIDSPEMVDWVVSVHRALLNVEPDVTQEALYRGIAVKAAVVAADARETRGVRERLNVGHTVAHALEATEGYGSLLHGEAVAVGLVWETALAVELGFAPPALLETVRRAVRAFELPTAPPSLGDLPAIVARMQYDKKNRGARVRFALLSEIGKVELVDLEAERLPALLSAALARSRNGA